MKPENLALALAINNLSDKEKSELLYKTGLDDLYFEVLANDPCVGIRMDVARHLEVPESVLTQLSTDSDFSVRQEVALNERTSISTLDKLSKDNSPLIRSCVAENFNASPNTLTNMYYDNEKNPDYYICIHLASNPNTPSEILENLASLFSKPQYNYWAGPMKEQIAGNVNTSQKTLISLGNDDDVDVLIAVAKNQNTPDFVIKNLCKKRTHNLRFALAKHRNLPREIIMKWMKTNNPFMAEVLALNPQLTANELEDLSTHNYGRDTFRVWRSIAENPNTSKNTLKKLSKVYDFVTKACIARHPNTSIEDLIALSKDDDWIVSIGLLENPNVPDEILEIISHTENPRVYAAYENLVKNHLVPNVEKSIHLSTHEDFQKRILRETQEIGDYE